MLGIGIPICVQCGTTSNPCRCKVVVPGVCGGGSGGMAGGCSLYCFRHMKGLKFMAHPAIVVYPYVTNAIAI